MVSHRFLFTSPCSFESKEVIDLMPEHGDQLGVVSSSGDLPDYLNLLEKLIKIFQWGILVI